MIFRRAIKRLFARLKRCYQSALFDWGTQSLPPFAAEGSIEDDDGTLVSAAFISRITNVYYKVVLSMPATMFA